MSYENLIQRDIPYAYYNLDNAGIARPPLVSGGAGSSRISTETVSYTLPVFDRRSQKYSIEIWFKPLSTASALLVGHEAENDGLRFANGKIIFDCKLIDETVSISYAIDQLQTFHVIASYDQDSMVMYVNGKRVASAFFTDDQRNKPYFAFTNPTTVVTKGLGNPIVVDAVAFYTHIDENLPARHYQWGTVLPDIIKNSGMLTGESFEFFYDNIKGNMLNVNWQTGGFNNTIVTNGALTQAQDQTGARLTGTWNGLVLLNDYENAVIDWDGSGDFDVEVSNDGDTYTLISRGGYINVPASAAGYVWLRVTLPAGDEARINSISVFIYPNQTITSHGGTHSLALANQGVLTQWFYPIEGKTIGTKGAVNVTVGSTPAKAVEFWIKAASATAITSLGGTQTVNNGAGFFPDDWNHVVVTGTFTGSFTIGHANSYVGIVNMYATAPDVPSLYLSYFGKNVFVTSDNVVKTITDDFVHYSYQWAIVASG